MGLPEFSTPDLYSGKEQGMAVPSLEELLRRVKASSEKGNLCSQIVVDVGLDHLGERKPDLLKAAGGLQGFVEVTCGA